MSDETPNEEKKILVDEDWKGQVEADREELRRQLADEPDAPGDSPTDEAAPTDTPADAPSDAPAEEQAMPLPPPTLGFLFGSLYLQGMIGLGMLPNPVDNQPATNLQHARHTIDMLAMLEEKTKGNRTNEESEELERILHELRVTFVTVQQTQGK